jgi:hypothetical protein
MKFAFPGLKSETRGTQAPALRKPSGFVSYDGVTVPARSFGQTQFAPINLVTREEAAL